MFNYLKAVSSAFSKFRWIGLALATAMLAAGNCALMAQAKALDSKELKPSKVLAQPVPVAWHEGEVSVLRFHFDRVRERGWILTPTGVLVFDLKTRRTIDYVALPDWMWAGEEFSCLPDLALGPKGEALVSSNVVPTLWRIDPETLAVTKHELALDADRDKDVGFTGLAYSGEEDALFAVSEFGALWRIDPLLQRARKIPLSSPIPKACGVTIRTTVNRISGLCIHGPQGAWTVDVAPDGRFGNVIARSCAVAQ